MKPYIGRFFTLDDERTPGESRVAVLSYGFWKRKFGGDGQIAGKLIHLNTVPMTVLGVTPPGFDGLDAGPSPDLRVPITMEQQMYAESVSTLPVRGDWWLNVIGRLKPGVTPARAQSELQPFLRAYLRANASGDSPMSEYRMRVQASERISLAPMGRGERSLGEQFGLALRVLMGVVGAVL